MSSNYNQSYSREEIEEVLGSIKKCIRNRQFTISMNDNRRENRSFIDEYNIRSDKQISILLGVQVEDFCYSVNNIKSGYEHEILYIFAPSVTLPRVGIQEVVDVYLKFNIIARKSGNFTVVISFHKLNRAIDYLFR